MTSDEKLEVLRQLGRAEVKYSDHTRKFYVSVGAEIKKGIFLSSGAEHRDTRDEAIDASFEEYTNADTIVIDAYKSTRREVTYNRLTNMFE